MAAWEHVREHIPPVQEDRTLTPLIEKAADLLAAASPATAAGAAVGELL